jgi:hypothetical protein
LFLSDSEKRCNGCFLVSLYTISYYQAPERLLPDAFCSLIPSEFTWGPLRISDKAFKNILASHHVFAPFVDVVQAYGSKIKENHHNWNGCRGNFSKKTAHHQGRYIYGKFKLLSNDSNI